MPYTNTLHFAQKLLRELQIKSHVITEPFNWSPIYDCGLRKGILPQSTIAQLSVSWPRRFTNVAKENILSRVTDEYHCEYICLRLPDNPCLTILLVGPFTYEKMTESRIIEICNELHIPGNLTSFVQRYYQTLPFVSDERWVKGMSRLLAETMWKNKKIHFAVYGSDQLLKPVYNVDHPSPTPNTLHRLELQYANEALLMNAVSNGDLITIDQMLEGGNIFTPDQKNPLSLRDKKNSLISFNTLCRKAAEKGHIHPAYLEETFEKNVYEIEQATESRELQRMRRRIVREYCLLVQSHSLKNYTQPIRQAINYISFHLTDDLSLSTIAKLLMLNSSYLSTLFKKETGFTLTYYVNLKRVEHAIFLLNTTIFPIQDIAVLCGIKDLNYFTKTFKKYQKITPSDYREMIKGK
ncbi:MAG: AraC family transcriptional regulator [Hespellia sp.]|jgi:two-component system response regulator YesN|nr:AraC family transcriptional regulator [Hespellia sp.]